MSVLDTLYLDTVCESTENMAIECGHFLCEQYATFQDTLFLSSDLQEFSWTQPPLKHKKQVSLLWINQHPMISTPLPLKTQGIDSTLATAIQNMKREMIFERCQQKETERDRKRKREVDRIGL